MVSVIADNILSPLGQDTKDNLQAVLSGRSALKLYENRYPCLEPFCAAMFEHIPLIDGFSRFESLAIQSASKALVGTQIDCADKNVIFILSSTKGNIEYLADGGDPSLVQSAQKIASHFGNTNPPVVVSNACISGVSAQITAMRLLNSGRYTTAVIIGCDVLSPFIISGFQSFKALSVEPCKPFDKSRNGLNLGEAAATMVLQVGSSGYASLQAGSMHNDANHISGPSRTAEGSYRCLKDVASDDDDIAFVNLHGTATAYNDEMESIAIQRAALQATPVNGLKGIFGHTLGAAGIIETLLSIHTLRQGLVLPTIGFEETGTTYPLKISSAVQQTAKTRFIKLLSGFGGCNAAIKINVAKTDSKPTQTIHSDFRKAAEVTITPSSVIVNGKTIPTEHIGTDMLTELYRANVNNYPKFFKMDLLSRLGFIASELLLSAVGKRAAEADDRAVIFANLSSSIKNDRDYQATIQNPDCYYPSPSLFVYTLPNIVTGEIAIRNKYYGETSFYLLQSEKQLLPLIESTDHKSVLAGWVEATDNSHFHAHLTLLER